MIKLLFFRVYCSDASKQSWDPDPHSFSLLDPGRKVFKIKTEKCKVICNNCKFIPFFKSKFAQAPLFLTSD